MHERGASGARKPLSPPWRLLLIACLTYLKIIADSAPNLDMPMPDRGGSLLHRIAIFVTFNNFMATHPSARQP
jgi:hypothetical protein